MLPTNIHQYDCKPKEQDANRELGGRGEDLAIYPRATPHAPPVFVFSVSARVWKKATDVATVLSELVCTAMVTAESWLQVPRLKPPPQPMILMPVPSLAPSGQLVRTNSPSTAYIDCVVCTMVGSREAALRSAAHYMISHQVHEEFHPPPSPPEYISTTRNDFHKGIHTLQVRALTCAFAFRFLSSQAPSHNGRYILQ